MIELRTHGAEETRRVAATLATVLRPGDVVVLSGQLGAGKTTFAQGAIAALGVDDPVTSPTFALLQEYAGAVPVVHADLYRLDTVQQLHDLGFAEIVDDARVIFVEWGERATQVLPADHLVVELELGDDPDERRVRVRAHGAGWAVRRERLQSALLAAVRG